MIGTEHPVTPEEVMALLDGELPFARVEFVKTHLKTCAECRHTEDALRSTSQHMAAWTVGLPHRLDERALLAYAQNRPSKDGTGSSFSWLLDIVSRRWVWAPALSLVAALIVFVTLIPNLFVAHKAPPSRDYVPLERPSALLVIPDRADSASKAGASGGGDAYMFRSQDELPPPMVGAERKATERAATAPMIARAVSLNILVKDFDSARAALDAILTRRHGYAAEMTANTKKGEARSLSASLRIPAPELTAATGELKALGRVETETQKGEEVTRQHADLVARLKNARETEQRLIDVLRTRTGKVSDVLEVEQEIARVRGEIEQMEAERKALEHRVDFATVDLKLKEEYKAQLEITPPSVGTRLRNSLVTGYRDASESLIGLVLFFAEYGPALLLWALILFWPVRFIWRCMRRAMARA